ncbi:hypothetical protein T05_7941, partial [Trichinella murrelli]
MGEQVPHPGGGFSVRNVTDPAFEVDHVSPLSNVAPHLMLCSPIELFHLIFPKERMQYYAEMTMRYAAQKGGNLVVDG